MREMAPAAARRRGVDGAAVLRQSFAKHYGGGGGVGEGEGGNQRPRRSGMKSLLSPTIYRGAKGGWPALGDPISKGGRRPRGWLAPQAKWGAPHP